MKDKKTRIKPEGFQEWITRPPVVWEGQHAHVLGLYYGTHSGRNIVRLKGDPKPTYHIVDDDEWLRLCRDVGVV